jgi:H+/Cl- antiporter ClcA
LAGAVFALEVLAIGRVRLGGFLACLIAGYAGDWACQVWGIHHTPYAITHHGWDMLLLIKAAVAGALFGLVSILFAEANHTLGGWLKRLIPYGPARPVVGGLAVIALTYALGTRAYLGLGVWSADPAAPTIAGFLPARSIMPVGRSKSCSPSSPCPAVSRAR